MDYAELQREGLEDDEVSVAGVDDVSVCFVCQRWLGVHQLGGVANWTYIGGSMAVVRGSCVLFKRDQQPRSMLCVSLLAFVAIIHPHTTGARRCCGLQRPEMGQLERRQPARERAHEEVLSRISEIQISNFRISKSEFQKFRNSNSEFHYTECV